MIDFKGSLCEAHQLKQGMAHISQILPRDALIADASCFPKKRISNSKSIGLLILLVLTDIEDSCFKSGWILYS